MHIAEYPLSVPRGGGTIGCMAILVAFLLGIGNFAWHRAVIESGNRMIAEMPTGALRSLRRVSLAFEFFLLCAAMYAVSAGSPSWLWAYLGYSALNATAAWMIVTRRI